MAPTVFKSSKPYSEIVNSTDSENHQIDQLDKKLLNHTVRKLENVDIYFEKEELLMLNKHCFPQNELLS